MQVKSSMFFLPHTNTLNYLATKKSMSWPCCSLGLSWMWWVSTTCLVSFSSSGPRCGHSCSPSSPLSSAEQGQKPSRSAPPYPGTLHERKITVWRWGPRSEATYTLRLLFETSNTTYIHRYVIAGQSSLSLHDTFRHPRLQDISRPI